MRRFAPLLSAIPLGLMAIGLETQIPALIVGGFLSWIICSLILLKRHTALGRLPAPWWWVAISLLSGFMIIETSIYVAYRSTAWTLLGSMAILSIGIILWIYARKRHPIADAVNTIIAEQSPSALDIATKRDLIFAFLIFILQIHIISLVRDHAVTDALVSPWQALGPSFFWWYGSTTLLTLFFAYTSSRTAIVYIASVLHVFMTLSIVNILYPLGFGYDPFLHRATEQHIFTHGLAEPKTPFYIGQYVLVNLLAHFTPLSLRLIDIWLVPFLAALAIPIATYLGLRHGWHMPERLARVGALLVPLYPLETMYVTTPHNTANLFLLTIILLLPILRTYRQAIWPLAVLALAALAIHPLSGIFAFLAFIVFLLWNNRRWFLRYRPASLSFRALLIVGSSVAIPSLFALYFFLNGIPLQSPAKILPNLHQFAQFFREPYYFSQEPVSLLLTLIYAYRRIIPILFLITCVAAYSILRRRRTIGIYILLALAMVANAFLVSTWLEFPLLDRYEQLQYSERILHSAIFFLIPGTIIAILFALKTIARAYRFLFIPSLITLAITLTASLYLTYPQYNAKVHFPGFNVTAADTAAVRQFAATGTSTDYIVLSNILTAAASVETYGFKKYYETNNGQVFYYAIPSGGPLALAFNDMLYQGQKRETIDSVLALTGANRAYFVVHSYWDDAYRIIEGAQKTADESAHIVSGNTSVWIFTYNRSVSSTVGTIATSSTKIIHSSPTVSRQK